MSDPRETRETGMTLVTALRRLQIDMLAASGDPKTLASSARLQSDRLGLIIQMMERASFSPPEGVPPLVEPESVFHQFCPRAKIDADGTEWPIVRLVRALNDVAGRQRHYACDGCHTEIVVNFPPKDLPQETTIPTREQLDEVRRTVYIATGSQLDDRECAAIVKWAATKQPQLSPVPPNAGAAQETTPRRNTVMVDLVVPRALVATPELWDAFTDKLDDAGVHCIIGPREMAQYPSPRAQALTNQLQGIPQPPVIAGADPPPAPGSETPVSADDLKVSAAAIRAGIAETKERMGRETTWVMTHLADLAAIADGLEEAQQRLLTLTAERDEARRLHQELLYQVAKKHPGETRHETAKRYLRQHENHCGQGAPVDARLSPSSTPEEPR